MVNLPLDKDVTEKVFLAQVRELAGYLAWLTYHTHDSRRSEPGFPDVVLVKGGRVIFAELKTEKGKPTAAQLKWLRNLRDAGCETHLWRPSHWDSIVETLRGENQ